MKRIGIDARLYFQTGVGVYLRNLLYELQQLPNKNVTFYVYVMEQDANAITFSDDRFIKRPVHEKWHTLSEQLGLMMALLQDKLDLMHFTYFSYPVLYSRPFIATVHDITPLFFKTGKASTKNKLLYEFKHKVFSFILSNQIKKARHIITPTTTIKTQIIKQYGEKYGYKITPISEGINYELIHGQENKELKTVYGSDYFLYVGNFYPHKNVESLIQAYAKVKSEKKLVLLGPKDYFTEKVRKLIGSLEQERRIVFFHGANIEDLIYMYKHAFALVHPSLSEGFGLPILEAMYFDKSIIASDIPVFQEITGGHYIKFNEQSPEDMRVVIESFLKSPTSYSYKTRMKDYSFKKMAEKTFALYNTYVS